MVPGTPEAPSQPVGRNAPWPSASSRLGDRYVLEEAIGSGGAAAVWRAYDDALDRSVAVKLLHPHLSTNDKTVERFRREAQAAAKLSHPNVVPIYDVGEEGDVVYLVMELIDGPSLADVIRRSGPLDPIVVAALGEQVAAALGEAHAEGLVHRDIKPANILVTSDGVVKLTDFGIVKALGDDEAQLTGPGTVVGTAAYIAPEQLHAGTDVDGRADVYALGVVLFECLTGRPAYQGDTPTATAAARLHEELPSPRQLRADVPRPLDDVLVRATRRDPDARFADGAALAAAFAALVTVRPSDVTRVLVDGDTRLPVAELTTTLPSLAPATIRSTRWLGLGIGALLLTAIALLATQALDDDGVGDDGPAPPGGGATAAIVAARDFDPFGSDLHESPAEVPFAFDGDPTTAWSTERYRTDARFGNLKPGAGIWFDLGEPVDVATVTVDLVTPGLTMQVHAMTTAPEDGAQGIDAFTPWGGALAGPVAVDATGQFEVATPAPARYWLLWLTELAPTSDGRFEGAVGEVRFTRR